ncbi:MAG: glycerol-3-phosphate dehydrogenase [Methylobacteriaceae bacterium]|nr:glycerol-3-phosphate dehydrogenase [Methylobacteriaceae bacterium]
MSEPVDLLIVGGGVNGCGVAREAVGRGLSVALVEMNDLASGTSSWSTKLIHGGLRYLEFYEFRLVRESLLERETLWRLAPHIIRPLRFVLPHHRGLRPAWLLRLGLFLYDHIGGRKLLPPTRTLDLTRDPAGAPLKPGAFARGFEYSDCAVDDARLVVLTARDAADRGADIRTRARLVSGRRVDGLWRVEIEDARDGRRETLSARRLVNAAGPWVAEVLGQRLGVNAHARVRLVQGSHIVVRRLYDHDRCYIFQTGDGRIVFAIPYQGDFTLIGTTDRDYRGDPADIHASAEEIAYLCAAASDYFARPVRREDVVWSYSGVRPLYDDGASEARAATRDYVFELDETDGAPLLSIFGGKITTYRRLASAALEKLGVPEGPLGADWTAGAPLPGGDFPIDGGPALIAELMRDFPFLAPHEAARLVAAYGTKARDSLAGAKSRADLGEEFGAGFTEAEARWLVEREWAMTAEDILWRRSKLGLKIGAEGAARLSAWMTRRLGVALPDTIRAGAA